MEGPPDVAAIQQACRAMGAQLEGGPAALPLWAELVPVVELFAAMRSQWVADAEGKPALNYGVLPIVERRIGMSPRRARAVFNDLRTMEAEGRAILLQRISVMQMH